MVHQFDLTNSSIWTYKEPWRVSYKIFLLFGIMMDIIVILIITRIIRLISKNNADQDYIKMSHSTPEFSAINITTLESAEDVIKKEDQSLLKATRVPSNEKNSQTEKLHSMIKKTSLELDKSKDSQRKITGLPPRDKLRHTEKLRQMRKTPCFDEIEKIEALSRATCEILSRNATLISEESSEGVARLQHKDTTCKTEELQDTQIVSKMDKINKFEEPCSTGLRIHEKNKSEESNLIPKSKIVKEEPIIVSTCNVPPNGQISQSAESKGMTTSQPYNEKMIKKKDQSLLSATRETKKTANDATMNQGPQRTKQKNMKLVEVESLSSEDYSALGVKDGTIPVPKNEYERKLIAIAMRYKIKEIQEKKLKEIEERKMRQKIAKAEAESKILNDLRTLSSDQKGSVGGGQIESASFEEIRRESVTENETLTALDAEEKKKEVKIETLDTKKFEETKSALMETVNRIKSAKDSEEENKSKSVFTSKDKELVEMYGNLSEEDLILEATSIVSRTDVKEIIGRLEPIRRRWKLPHIDGLPSTEETQTFSTGNLMPHSPWDPSYRITGIFNDTLMGDKPSDTLSSGTSMQKPPKIFLKLGKKEDEISSMLTTADQEHGITLEDSTCDDEFETKKSASSLSDRRIKGTKKAEDREFENDPTSSAYLSTVVESLPSGTSAEPEVIDLRTASPLYRLNVSKNRRRLRGIQSKVRQLEERAKEMAKDDRPDSKTQKSETQISSVSISSGDSPGNEAKVTVSLMQPLEAVSSFITSLDQSKNQAVDSNDTVVEAATKEKNALSASQLSQVSEDGLTTEAAHEQDDRNHQESQKLEITSSPSDNRNAREQVKFLENKPEKEEEARTNETTNKQVSVSRSSTDYAERVEINPSPENKDRPYLKRLTYAQKTKRQKIIREATPPCPHPPYSNNVSDEMKRNCIKEDEPVPQNWDCDLMEDKAKDGTSNESEYL